MLLHVQEAGQKRKEVGTVH